MAVPRRYGVSIVEIFIMQSLDVMGSAQLQFS